MKHVFIIDIDGTIVGDVCFQVAMFNIHQYLKQVDVSPLSSFKLNHISKCYNPEYRLVRPFFPQYIQYLREQYGKDVYIFIYTASDHKWALKEVPMIEKECNIKFNRPIFTRKHLVNNKKSIGAISNKIKSVVGRDISNTRLTIIDNNVDVYADYRDYIIQCPDYNYKLFYDLWNIIPVSSLGNKKKPTPLMFIAKQYLRCNLINPICTNILNNKTSSITDVTPDVVDKISKCQAWFMKVLREISKSNVKYKNDDFWLRLRHREVRASMSNHSR